MSFETKRINEIAKELSMTSKELLEKLGALGIKGKTHSSTLTPDQEKRLVEFVKGGSTLPAKKPKAFVVKKAKAPEAAAEAPVAEEKEKPEAKKVEIERPKRPQIEIVKPQSRLEIVRRAPQRPQEPSTDSKSADAQSRKFPPRGERPERPERAKKPFGAGQAGQVQKPGERPRTGFKKPGERPEPTGERKPIQRHIISQEIYENKGSGRKRSDGKKKDKDFNKKEEQERISLEKAAAQKHKKHVQKEEEVEKVTQIVVDRAMTISELAGKIQKTPAEIVKFLMFQGVMATVNQLIDIDVIKKICAEYELEVLDEDLEAYMEEELQKEWFN